jgi:hypothetical protein
MLEQIIKAYNEAIFDTDREQALKVIHDAVAQGISPEDVIFKIVVPAIEQMVKSISEDFDANLAQHFMTSQIAAEVTEEMLSRFKTAPVIAGRGLTCGVINDIRLIDWTRDEIRAEVRRLIAAGMPGGKFLFGTAVMPYQIPERNIRTMLAAAYEFGSYNRGD